MPVVSTYMVIVGLIGAPYSLPLHIIHIEHILQGQEDKGSIETKEEMKKESIKAEITP